MQSIKLNFSDFWKGFDKENNFFINLLRKKYDVKISEKPDFLIYSVFGMEYLKYDCIRIFYTGENFTPDFNLCDYGIGFDWIKFDDRYFRLPLYTLYSKQYKLCRENKQFKLSNIQERKFCNFIYSNGKAAIEREDFFNKLSDYKFIHSGGRFRNNIGGRVEDKYAFQQEFKFSIAFENSSTNGYTTEKILEAKAAGTVPIYWGNPLVSREMNNKAFINCHDYKSPEDVIEYIKFLDQNDEELLKIINQPLFKHEIYDVSENDIISFFDHIFSVKEKYRKGHFQKNREAKWKIFRIMAKITNLLKY